MGFGGPNKGEGHTSVKSVGLPDYFGKLFVKCVQVGGGVRDDREGIGEFAVDPCAQGGKFLVVAEVTFE